MIVKNSKGTYCNISPGWGIIERLADRISVFCILVGITIFVSLAICMPPSKWYHWIIFVITALIGGWQSVVLLPLAYLIEVLIWWLCHPGIVIQKCKINKMSDTKFKWLACCATVAFIVVAYFVNSVDNDGDSSEFYSDELVDNIGEYVYVDERFNVIHIDRHCVTAEGVRFVDTCEITDRDKNYSMYRFCPNCIDDFSYKHLSAIITRNSHTLECYKAQDSYNFLTY